ncbi:MAG: AsmA family protein [Elusimicrobiota bacterium]
MSEKYKKILIIFGVVVLLILFIGYISFKIVFSPAKLKETIQKQAVRILNREVTVESARLKPGELTLNNVRINFRENEQELKRKASFYAVFKRVDFKFKILPLFNKNFVFKKVELISPEINAVRTPTIDVGGLIKQAVTGALVADRISFNINAIKIQKGRINIMIPEISGAIVRDIYFNVQQDRRENLIEAETRCKFENTGIRGLDFSSIVDLKKNKASIEYLKLTGFEGKMNISGDVSNLSTEPELNLKYVVEEFPYGLLPENLDIQGSPIVRGEIKNKLNEVYCEFLVNFDNNEIDWQKIYRKPFGGKLSLQGGFTYRKGFVSVNWYVLNSRGLEISGTGMMDKQKELNINMRADSIDFGKISDNLIILSRYINRGSGSLKGKISGQFSDPEFSSQAELENIRIRNLEPISELYKKITGYKKTRFKIEKADIDFLLNKKRLTINKFTSLEGNIEGRGSGYYEWGDKLDFTVYPIIRGNRVGLRIYGSPDNIKISLK